MPRVIPLIRKTWLLIKSDGQEIGFTTKPSIQEIREKIGAPQGLDFVDLGNGQVMAVDDVGLVDGKPINYKATELYHSVCVPFTMNPICGDVAIAWDADFD